MNGRGRMAVALSGTVMVCTHCGLRELARPFSGRPDTAYEAQFHHCRARAGLFAPLHPEGLAHKETVIEREDYIGTDRVQLVDGRPVMAVETTRDTGTDRVVFAPIATGRVQL